MFNFLLSPFAKLFGVGILAIGLIGFGYYKGYSSEHEKFLDYKAEIAAQVKSQELLTASRIKQEQIKTEGIINEYKAKLVTIRNSTSRVQYSTGTVQLSETTAPKRTTTAPSYTVLVGQCLETTLMLTSLQEWVKYVSEQ